MGSPQEDSVQLGISLRHRVWLRLVLVTSLLLVIAVAITAAFVARLASAEIRSSVTQRNEQLARSAAEDIDLYIQGACASFSRLANALALGGDQPRVRAMLLDSYASAAKSFDRIALVDDKGRILSDSLAAESSVSGFDPETMEKAMARETWLSPVHLSPDGRPHLTVVAPVPSPGPGAAILGELLLTKVGTIVDSMAAGSRSASYVTTDSGTLVAWSDRMEGAPGVAAAPTGEKGLKVESRVPSMGWTVVIEQPPAEAFLPVSLLLTRSLVLILLVLLVIAYLAFFSVRMISKPLDALLRGTIMIARGAADYRIPVDSKDEFGILSRSFNEMVRSLQERAVALEESERKYRIVAESVTDIIFSLDAKGRFVFLNRRAEQILGYRLNEMLGRLFIDFICMEEMAASALVFLQALSDKSKTIIPAEIPLISKTGEEVILDCEAVTIYEPSGEVLIHGVGRDITERRRLEERLKRTEKLSAMGEMASRVAHELRNAVSGITASMELVKARDGSGLRKDLDRVLAEATRAQNIVHSLLDFSREKQTSIHPCPLNTSLEDVVELCRRDIESARINVRMILDSGQPSVLANPDQLRQVFLNLVTNAIQAMKNPARGLSPSAYNLNEKALSITTEVRDGSAVVTVEDTGPGIPRKVMGRIFDPFFTTKRQGEGTGLGLSVSLGIVQSLGGDIRVESTEGRGAAFHVELPVVKSADMEAGAAETGGAPAGAPDPADTAPFDLSSKRILVVEDEDSIREFICNFLRSYGCSVDSARDVREAVAFLSESLTYDMVISDFRMPEIDGQGLYEWLRSNKPVLLSRIMYITGDGLNQLTRAFLRKTGVPYLLKPVSSMTLVKAIRPFLFSGRSQGPLSGDMAAGAS